MGRPLARVTCPTWDWPISGSDENGAASCLADHGINEHQEQPLQGESVQQRGLRLCWFIGCLSEALTRARFGDAP